jgi:hypothetical protein
MTGGRAICLVIYWLALTLWISALVSAAVAAMNVFPTMTAERLPLRLDEYAALPTTEHPRIAAGVVMNGVFATIDVMQFIAIPIALLALVAQLTIFATPGRRAADWIRTGAAFAAAGLFAYHASSLAPKMNHALNAFWSAAKAGDIEAARTERAAFNELHPTADAILRADLLLLLVAAGASAIALAPVTRMPRLEIPELARP